MIRTHEGIKKENSSSKEDCDVLILLELYFLLLLKKFMRVVP